MGHLGTYFNHMEWNPSMNIYRVLTDLQSMIPKPISQEKVKNMLSAKSASNIEQDLSETASSISRHSVIRRPRLATKSVQKDCKRSLRGNGIRKLKKVNNAFTKRSSGQ